MKAAIGAPPKEFLDLFRHPDMYVGETLKQQRHGSGRYLFPNGFLYDGQWKNGKMTGKGVMYMGSSGKYEGEFFEGEITGTGVRSYGDGSVYSGEFVKGMRSGKGIFKGIVLRGVVGTLSYDGMWLKNAYSGTGKLLRSDGSSYIGEWSEHKRHGRGKEIRADESSYDGEWENGLRNGQGVEYSSTGSIVYSGGWGKDLFHGEGEWNQPASSIVFHGHFSNGIPVEQIVMLKVAPFSGVVGDDGTTKLVVEAGCSLPILKVETCLASGEVVSGESGRTIVATLSCKSVSSPRTLKRIAGIKESTSTKENLTSTSSSLSSKGKGKSVKHKDSETTSVQVSWASCAAVPGVPQPQGPLAVSAVSLNGVASFTLHLLTEISSGEYSITFADGEGKPTGASTLIPASFTLPLFVLPPPESLVAAQQASAAAAQTPLQSQAPPVPLSNMKKSPSSISPSKRNLVNSSSQLQSSVLIPPNPK
eukprot:TRINITY_DN13424_c0_g1_i1.p1 TRINITY_DN13424_c0_g1~~TRINITY_DN13424_c0_g1_i1.p1  ORF type:complete len:476 (+),score=112.21 TRINITY_DN13424_c0_g1_i1:46-1473(+)